MAQDFEASKPIYMQIAEQVYQQIVRGDIRPGDKLSSVREMAIQTGVNPNTIQRSYGEMERMGVVETRRGQGTFVVGRDDIVTELKQQMQHEIITNFVSNMQELGLTKREMIERLELYCEAGDTDGD